MVKQLRKINWLDLYRRLRKPTAPPPKPHGTKGYTKADRTRAKRAIEKDNAQ
jgi:hypothetical protein